MGRAVAMGGGILGLVCVVAIVGYLMVGGDEPLRPGETSTSTGGAPSAPTGGGYIERNVATLDYAKRQMWEVETNRAIEFYRAENGANPPSLDTLEAVRELPEGYAWEYDSGTGVARIVDAPR
ncbi:MAG: hypothetical protein HY608_00460 [Planctomycetes bacterium]|nr:hypothetical protein [Planctomycetota bacterium]